VLAVRKAIMWTMYPGRWGKKGHFLSTVMSGLHSNSSVNLNILQVE